MSIWDWLRASLYQADQAKNPIPEQIYNLYSEAMSYHSKEPARTVAMLAQARDLATQSQELWWAQFCEHWRLQIMLCDQRDYGNALDAAVHAAVETRKPFYAQFPQRICIQEDLISSYMGIDPEGYAEQAEQALDYMQREVSPDAECNHCINELRTEIALNLNRLDAAETSALTALQRAKQQGDRMHSAIAFRDLCTIAYRRGDYHLISGYAQEAVTDAFAARHNLSILSGLMWQALGARKRGEEREASRAYRTVSARLNQTGAFPGDDFYEALTGFHEAAGQYEQALQSRLRELEQIRGKGQILAECKCRLDICRLYRLMGQKEQVEAQLQAVEAIAQGLKRPTSVLAKVNEFRESSV